MINSTGILETKARFVVAFLVVISTFFTAMYGYSVYQQARSAAINETSLYAQSITKDLQQYIDKYISDVRMLALSPLIADIAENNLPIADGEDKRLIYQRLSKIFKAYMGSNHSAVQTRLLELDNEGIEVVRVNRVKDELVNVVDDLLQSKAHRDYFAELTQLSRGQVYVSDINLNQDFGAISSPYQPVIRIAAPVYNALDTLYGVVMLNIDLSDYLLKVAQPLKTAGETAYALLLDGNGNYLAHPDSSKNFGFEFDVQNTFDEDFKQQSEFQVISKNGAFLGLASTRFFFSKDQVSLASSNRTFEAVALVAVQPVIISTLMSAIYLEALLLVVAIAFMTYLIYSRRNLALEKKQASLKAELEFDIIFREMIETAPYAKILLNEKGVIEMANIEAEKMFGYKRTELIDQHIDLIIPPKLEKHSAEPDQSEYFSAISNLSTRNASLVANKKNGLSFPVEVSLTSLESHLGKKIQATILDVSEREKFIAELSRQNRELNQFAYVASHDLKAPLRGIDQIASWLEEDLQETVGADTKKHLRLMRSRINRMESLLAGLLQYARAGSVLGEIETINLQQLVEDDFHMINVTHRFELEIKSELPTLKTSKPLIDIVFRNLISNAMKHHDRPKGTIVIDHCQLGLFYQFTVCDDGPGIPEEFRERVFGLFQTLKPRDEVEGSGMGLSIVKKTIETIGGEISIGDCEPSGAKITFTWPMEIKKEADEPIA